MQPLAPVELLLVDMAAFANVVDIVTASDVEWDWRPAEKEWNLVEVMCHLRDVELEVHQPRFRAILVNDNPFIAGVDAIDNFRVRHNSLGTIGTDGKDMAFGSSLC